MNSEDQYRICMNKLKSGAPSKILKQGNDKKQIIWFMDLQLKSSAKYIFTIT